MRQFIPALLIAWSGGINAQTPVPPPAAQNPSPMVEHGRKHARLERKDLPGTRRSFEGPLGKPVELFVPASARRATALHLVVHFLGASFIAEEAVTRLGNDHVSAVLNLGAGSGIFDRTFSPPEVFDTLLAGIRRELATALAHPVRFTDITLSGFSAGHGAIRAILRDSAHFAQVKTILLLDGMHTSYVPEGVVVEKGGTLDTTKLAEFLRFGRAAMAKTGDKSFVITHSEIFPGTFASTTETADYLVQALGAARMPVLKWGPGGMQQLSEVRAGRFAILGFAGNAGPDHIDQLHGMPEFLRLARTIGRR